METSAMKLTTATHINAEVEVLESYMSTNTSLVALRANPEVKYEVDSKALTDIKTFDLGRIFN